MAVLQYFPISAYGLTEAVQSTCRNKPFLNLRDSSDWSLMYDTMMQRDEKEQTASGSSSPLETMERSLDVGSSTSVAIVVVSSTLSALK